MLNFLTTFTADTQFQKNRLLLTRPNYEGPNQQCMKNILYSFAGEDEQTRAQIAYACIIKKINNSPSKENWLYLLKNLIILDRVMSDNRFCQELSQTVLFSISSYYDKDSKSQAVNGKALLQGYWQLIQDICRLKISRKHILHYKRSERKGFLQSLRTEEILKQIKIIQKLFDSTVSLIFLTCGVSNNKQNQRQTQIFVEKSVKLYNQFTSSPLAEYLNIHFYSKLLMFFSCQYLCIHKFIQIILHTTKTEKHSMVSVQDAKLFKKMIFKFKSNCQDMKLMVQKNKGKKGFENIDTREFSAFSEQHIIKAIDQYIHQASSVSQLQKRAILQTFKNPQSFLVHPLNHKFVQTKPIIERRYTSVKQKTPRKFIEYNKQPHEDNPFDNYFNSYSDEFPHKNMMTIDLIQDIRRDEENAYQQILQSLSTPQRQNALKIEDNEQQKDFFKQFKKQKSKLKFKDIVVFDKDLEKEDQSTSYSVKNSSRGGSLFDVLNIKWIPQKNQA